MLDVSHLAAQFERFAQVECGSSPLYRHLARSVAADPDLLALAGAGTGGPKPNLFFAAVHCLLLDGATPHGLARFYPTLGGTYSDGDEAYPHFRAFCLEHRAQIEALIATRRVQTNEVARAAFLLPALALIARRGAPDQLLALVEVGTSAGLLLHVDRYAYDYGDGRVHGTPGSPLTIRCDLRGDRHPPLPDGAPAVAARVGIDLNPIDLGDPEERRWLKALVWGDQVDRFRRLEQAITLAAANPPRLLAGDGIALTGQALDELPPDLTAVVFHCHTLNQFTPEMRERFAAVLAGRSAGRPVYQLSLEYMAAGALHPEMRLKVYAGGVQTEETLLARYHAHGEWLEWLAE